MFVFNKVFIITEGGKDIGFGHMSRCISLSQAFEEKGFMSEFVVNGDDSVKDLLKGRKYKIFDWLKEKEWILHFIKGRSMVVVDSYLADFNFYKRISELVDIPVYIDDNMRLNYPRGIVFNGLICAEEIDYPIKKGLTYLLGVRYAPLRKEFWKVPDKNIKKNIETILVMFGGDDIRNMMPKILRFLRGHYPHLKKNVAIGRSFNNIDLIKSEADSNTNLIYYPKAEQIKKIMLKADVAISAGGQTLSELARVGVPTAGICVAKNQERNLEGWQRHGFVVSAGWYEDKELLFRLSQAIDKLMPQGERIRCSKAGRDLIDGGGAIRTVEALIRDKFSLESRKTRNHEIELRNAGQDDCYDLWSWRNHPEVRKWSFSPDRIEYDSHKEWFDKKIQSKQSRIYIAVNKEIGKVGQVRFESNADRQAYINVNLNPAFFGKGFGNRIIKLATEAFMKEKPKIKEIIAEVVSENIVSKKAFQKAGYVFSHNLSKADRQTTVFKFKKVK